MKKYIDEFPSLDGKTPDPSSLAQNIPGNLILHNIY